VLRQSPGAITCKPCAVSIFRPARTVTAPDGVEWELYASRFALPPWRPAKYSGSSVLAGGGWGSPADLLFFVLELPLFVVKEILVPVGRMLRDLPAAALQARHARTVTVEAICFWPRKVSLVWTAPPQHTDRVLSQVAAALARGEEARPLGATFVGRHEH
jgi:hypothetical protein